MSKTYKDGQDYRQTDRQTNDAARRDLSVRGVRRNPPDLRKLSRAVIALAMAEAAAEAGASADAWKSQPGHTRPTRKASND